MGFQQVERGELPLKAWRDCLRCPKFNSCDEIAVVRILSQERWSLHHMTQQLSGDLEFADPQLVQLPVVKSIIPIK
jgi:amino-acid N-acetyltransferase